MRRAAVIAAVLLGASPAGANPVDLFGFGARAPGMGGAHTAATADGSANYYNPGALALGDHIRFDVGYQYARPRLSLNGGDQGVDTSRGTAIGVSIPFRLEGKHVMTLGTGLFLPDERIILGRTLPASQPRWALYDNRPQRLFFAAHAAFRLPHRVYVGAGLGFIAETTGTYALSGRLGFPDSLDSELRMDVDVDVTPALYPQAGVLWQAAPWLRLGITYRGEFVADTMQIIAFDADIGPESEPIVRDAFVAINAVALDLFQPAQVSVGAAATLADRWLVAFDATYERWSTFENPTPIIDIELDVGQFNPLVDLPEAEQLEPADFHDVLTLRLGAELEAARSRRAQWKLRAGYAYQPTPAPEQSGESNFFDNDRHTFAMGGGVTLRDITEILPLPLDLDLFVSYTLLPAREHHKRSAANATGDVLSKGSIWAGGVSSGWRF